MAGEFLQDARTAQNLVVLRTSPGNANALAATLDKMEWPEVVGTIAGDDTILLVAPDPGTATKLRQKLLGYIQMK
jgi:transcriptional regulator of arginine metabolism